MIVELFKEILSKALEKEEITVVFTNLNISAAEIVESKCYKTLLKIKAVIGDDSLSDFDCIERIVSLLEDIGSGGGGRHDFG